MGDTAPSAVGTWFWKLVELMQVQFRPSHLEYRGREKGGEKEKKKERSKERKKKEEKKRKEEKGKKPPKRKRKKKEAIAVQ